MQKTLAYHSIGENNSRELGSELYSVPEKNFREQMKYISSQNVIITFDDGLVDNYTIAYPILREFKLSAYFFVIPPLVGTPGYMDWLKIKLLKDAGMQVGSHGMTHRILTGLSEAELEFEFKESKKIIEDKLGASIDHISIPRGFYNQKIINKAREAGYGQVFDASRISVKANWSTDKFIDVLNHGYSFGDRARFFVRNTAKAILGPENYDRMRSGLLKKNISY